MERHDVIRALGAVRIGVGTALTVAPATAGEIWVGEGARGPGSRVFARALGARDLALGVGILTNVDTEPARAAHLVQLGVIADLADVAATLIAWRNLEGARRWINPLIALAVAGAGTAVWRMAEDTVEATEADVPVDAIELGVVDQQGAALSQMSDLASTN